MQKELEKARGLLLVRQASLYYVFLRSHPKHNPKFVNGSHSRFVISLHQLNDIIWQTSPSDGVIADLTLSYLR